MDGWVDGGGDGLMDGGRDGGMEGGMDRCTCTYMHTCTVHTYTRLYS